MRGRSGYAKLIRRAVAGAVMVGFLLTLALAISPRLHHLVHQDTDQRNHVCLATALQAGQYEDTVPVTVAVTFRASPNEVVLPHDFASVESFYLSCRLLEHGPPSILAS